MTGSTQLFHGIVKNGVVVPDLGTTFPEGTEVQFRILPIGQMTPTEKAEFEAWDQLGDEAWSIIDQWEREENNGHR